MKPSRELDISIARLMGFVDIGEGDVINLSGLRSNVNLRTAIPDYSTDIGDAWEAWEWLEQNHSWGSQVLLSLCRGGVDKKLPTVRISQKGEWGEITAYREIVGESYPHAICLAVLLAKAEKGF